MKLTKFANFLVIGLIVTVAASGCKKKPTGLTPLPGVAHETPQNPPPGGRLAGDTTGGGNRVTLPEGPISNPTPPPFSGNVTPTQPPTIPPAATNTTGIAQTRGHEGWREDPAALQAQTVYFDFDSSVVKTAERPKVEAVADYLRGHPNDAVRVEGNCDERGTEEYNRALGERRALAVREELVRLGIDPSRVDTISYGKDKPAVMGHDDEAWAKNRRDDFVVLSPPTA